MLNQVHDFAARVKSFFYHEGHPSTAGASHRGEETVRGDRGALTGITMRS
jgi:hypothetical protein